MFVTSASAAAEAASNHVLLFNDDAPHGLIALFKGGVATTSDAASSAEHVA